MGISFTYHIKWFVNQLKLDDVFYVCMAWTIISDEVKWLTGQPFHLYKCDAIILMLTLVS